MRFNNEGSQKSIISALEMWKKGHMNTSHRQQLWEITFTPTLKTVKIVHAFLDLALVIVNILPILYNTNKDRYHQ